jgi:hypothetical protein
MASTSEQGAAGSYFKHNGHNTFLREDGVSSFALRIFTFRDEIGSYCAGTVG